MSSPFPSSRILPIDIFRGITILVMIFVNELSSVQGIPLWATHMAADADAMTFVDIVFPAFLFIVGMSIPFAIEIRSSRGANKRNILTHAFIRGISLIVIGVYMVNTIGGWNENAMPVSIHLWSLLMYTCIILIWVHYPKNFSPKLASVLKSIGLFGLAFLWWIFEGVNEQGMTTQWWGILGLIGWAYIMAVPVYLLSNKIAVLVTIIIVYFSSFLLLNFIASSENYFLQLLIDNRRNATHAAITLMGTLLSILIYRKDCAEQGLHYSMIFFVVTLVLSFACWQISPISKIWATPTWGLFSAAACIVSFLIIHVVIEKGKIVQWTKLFEPSANNALLIYILPSILFAILSMVSLPSRPSFFSAGLLGVGWTLMFTIVIMYIASILDKQRFRLKL